MLSFALSFDWLECGIVSHEFGKCVWLYVWKQNPHLVVANALPLEDTELVDQNRMFGPAEQGRLDSHHCHAYNIRKKLLVCLGFLDNCGNSQVAFADNGNNEIEHKHKTQEVVEK